MTAFHQQFTDAGVEPPESAARDLQKRLDEMNARANRELSARLKEGYGIDALSVMVMRLWGDESVLAGLRQKPYFTAIAQEYQSVMNAKNELDNLLLRGQIGHGEYAGRVNGLVTKLALGCAGALSDEEFGLAFGCGAEDAKKGLNIVEEACMPESYEKVKETLGL
jgi:hypothetical protein